jgi:hypothetical protein
MFQEEFPHHKITVITDVSQYRSKPYAKELEDWKISRLSGAQLEKSHE